MFFTSDRIVRGAMTDQYDKPEWGPLEELAADHADEFMWMFEVELEKIRNDNEPGSYREVDPRRLRKEVLRRRGG